MYLGKKTIGIILARGGSKRLPRKNILPLNGKPLIAYAIQSALASGLDRVIVSTDDEEIAEVARSHGAEVPFLRPREIARDTTPDQPVYRHALTFLAEKGDTYDYVLPLRPTTPLRLTSDIDQIVKVAVDGGYDLVRSVTPLEGTAHPYWLYKAGVNNSLEPLFADNNVSIYYQSQQLPHGFFALNGIIDIMSYRQVMEAPSVHIPLDGRLGYIEIPRERAIDIDDATDFAIAEILIKKQSLPTK